MKINNKQVNTRFGMLAVEVFLTKSVSVGTGTYSAFGIASIIWAGIVNYYEVKEITKPVTFEEVYDHVESEMLTDSQMDEIKAVLKEFEYSQALKKKTEQLNEAVEEVKKKNMTSENLPTSQD
jgi:hypothetical protein